MATNNRSVRAQMRHLRQDIRTIHASYGGLPGLTGDDFPKKLELLMGMKSAYHELKGLTNCELGYVEMYWSWRRTTGTLCGPNLPEGFQSSGMAERCGWTSHH